jgi:hypothetical protein
MASYAVGGVGMADEMKGSGMAKGEVVEKEKTKVTSDVAEKAVGQFNPSSPGNTGTTPGTNAKVG